MARKQSKKHRLFGNKSTSAPASSPVSSGGPSQAPVHDITSITGASGDVSQGTLARMRRILRRSNGGSVPGMQEQREHTQAASTQDTHGPADNLETGPVPAARGSDIDTTAGPLGNDNNNAVDPGCGVNVTLGPAPALVGSGVDAVEIHDFRKTDFKPLKVFREVATTLPVIHPFSQLTLRTLAATSRLFLNQTNLDPSWSPLLEAVIKVYEFLMEEDTIKNVEAMQDTLAKISLVISDSAQFIKNYPEAKNYWRRIGKNIFAETQTILNDYNKNLNGLMQIYRDRAVWDIELSAYRMLGDWNLEGMAYVRNAGPDTTKKCLDGTRTEILGQIVHWITDPDVNVPPILWLNGQAGSGKSTIAHTITSWVQDVGGLGSCFCFSRDRQFENREEMILTTIARGLADRNPTFRRALGYAISRDRFVTTTPDVARQWQQLILKPLSRVSRAVVGNVVIVIDALDESGSEESRKNLLSALASVQAADLIRNIRVLITSRPLPDIEGALSGASQVKVTSLDVSAASTERDVPLYISKQLSHLGEISASEVRSLAEKSGGLFEWARLACEFIKLNSEGQTVKERYNDVILLHSRGEGNPLDILYRAILDRVMTKEQNNVVRFRSVMRQVLSVLEPLPVEALNEIRSHFPYEEDHYDVAIILEPINLLLAGVTDMSSPVQLLHSSFCDFLTDPLRSGVFFIDTSDVRDLAFASLQVLCHNLQFNICGVESSYQSNAQIPDLPKRINQCILPHLSYACQFWAQHLQGIAFDLRVAGLVKALVGSEKILFWLEALSLLDAFGCAVDALGQTEKWLLGQKGVEDALAFTQDAIELVQNFGSVISHSAPHLYVSSLPFVQEKMLQGVLMPRFPCLVGVSTEDVRRWKAAGFSSQENASQVLSVAFSPDGMKIVSGTLDSCVRVWDAEWGAQIGSPMEGHTDWVQSVAFSPDGRRIVSGSSDKTLRIWDVERNRQVGGPLLGHTSPVISVAFSLDCKRVVSGSYDNTVRVWDADRGIQISSLLEGHTSCIRSLAFSPDGERIASGSLDNTVRVWETVKGGQACSLLKGHKSRVMSVAFSPDGKRVVSGSDDNTVRLWDTEAGEQIGDPLKGHTSWVRSVAFSPDGKKIVSGSNDNTVRLWDAEGVMQIGNSLEGHMSLVYSVAFSPDGKRIVSGSADNTVRVWDVQNYGDMIHTQEELNSKGICDPNITMDVTKAYSICFSPVPSHALCDTGQLLDGLLQEDSSMKHEPVRLHEDGWIRGPAGRLLLWIPPAFWRPFYSIWTMTIIPRGCCIELDLSQMVHGQRWHECYRPAP